MFVHASFSCPHGGLSVEDRPGLTSWIGWHRPSGSPPIRSQLGSTEGHDERSAADAGTPTVHANVDATHVAQTSLRDRRTDETKGGTVRFFFGDSGRHEGYAAGGEKGRLNAPSEMLQQSTWLGKSFTCPARKAAWRGKRHNGSPWKCQVESVADSTNASSRKVTLRAQRKASLQVVEGRRPLKTYMQLPVEQYSVLDAERIERVEGNIFKCYLSRIQMFQFVIEPILIVQVDTFDTGGCKIEVVSADVLGSPAVVRANDKFKISSRNIVNWEVLPGDEKMLHSDTSLAVELDVPRWFIIPIGSIESTGNFVLSQTLNQVVPRFLAQLRKDYEIWAAGDDSRAPVDSGAL